MIMNYKEAGVDIEAGNAFVEKLKQKAPSIGGFGGMFKVPDGYSEPVLVSGTDGVGTGFAGMASSVLAIGAGAIYVPVLNQFGGLESRQAIGTSYGLMIMVVPVGVIVHVLLYSGDWPSFWNVFFLPFAVLSGSILGAKVGLLLPEQIILRGFISILGIIFIRYFIDILTQIF